MNKVDMIMRLKKVYLFYNQNIDEKNNFLNSAFIAIEKIVAGEKVIHEIGTRPYQTALDEENLGLLYNHLFSEYFDTINFTKKKLIYQNTICKIYYTKYFKKNKRQYYSFE